MAQTLVIDGLKRRTLPINPILPPDSRRAERSCGHDFAHWFFRGGRVRDIPARRHAPCRRRLAAYPGAGRGVQFGCEITPSHVRRLEAGILSYGQDMDIENIHLKSGLAGRWI